MVRKNAKLIDIEEGIETCLANGKRLFDDAYFLYENGRFNSSIPLYIFAYEEFGKASFLYLRFAKNNTVKESDLEKLLHGRGAHLLKLMLDYERVSLAMYGMGKQGFQSMQDFAAKYGLPSFNTDYNTAIRLHEITYSLVPKFHDIKMAFLYADYFQEKWQIQQAFQQHLLKPMCEYLHGHVLRPYLSIKSSMFLLSLGVPYGSSVMTGQQEQQFFQNPFVIQLKELYARYESEEWYDVRSLGRAALECVDIKPKN